MKVAVSIPDPLFQEGDRVAKRLRISRSELYAKAIDTYVRSRRAEDVTEQLNRVYAEQPAGVDPALAALQVRVLLRDPW
jgi:metal-responsive CopG/Arc/MetJ family transcriptional regulator